MQFIYDGDVPTIESTIAQTMQITFMGGDRAVVVAAATEQIRTILTFELTGLLDQTGVAYEWNDAIEAAMKVVETVR